MKILRVIDKHLEGFLLAVMLTALAALVLIQVFMRYLVKDSLTWSEELCRLLLVWSGFFSIGYCIRNGTTICLNTLVVILPQKVQQMLSIVTSVVMFLILCYLTQGTWDLILSQVKVHASMAGLGISNVWLYLGPLAGLALGAVRVVQSAVLTCGFSRPISRAGKEGQ